MYASDVETQTREKLKEVRASPVKPNAVGREKKGPILLSYDKNENQKKKLWV